MNAALGNKMNSLIQLIKWTSRMWPVLIPVMLATLHYLGFVHSSVNWVEINNIIPPLFQIIGGILILYSIDSNLGITKNTSLSAVFINYTRSFPLIKQHYTVEADSTMHVFTGLEPKIRVSNPTNTLEEKIDYLQNQIDWLKEDLENELKNISTKMTKSEDKTAKLIKEIKMNLGSVENKVTDLSIGGLKTQIFGVLLMVHGAMVSYYA